MDAQAEPRGAVEPVAYAPPPRLTFAAGLGTGVALSAAAAQLWLSQQLAPMRGIGWAELAPETLRPWTERLAFSAAWQYGSVVAILVAVAALLGLRVRPAWAYAVVAVLAVAVPVLTYTWATSPLTELAGNIRAD